MLNANHRSRVRLLAALAASVAAACASEPASHVDSDVAFEYRTRIETGRIHPQWELTRVSRRLDQPSRLAHEVHVPPEAAGDLMMLGTRERGEKVASIACPPSDDPIWQELQDGQDVEIDMFSDNGRFDTVSCRQRLF